MTVIINSAAVNRALAQLEHNVTHIEPALDAIGQTIEDNISLLFRDTETPTGEPWKPLSRATIANRRNGSSKPLNDTGILKGSITHNTHRNSVEIGAGSAAGDYAALQNFGATKSQMPNLWGDVPARQFIPNNQLPQSWENDVLDIITHAIEL